MPWYNADFSMGFNIFAHAMVVWGLIASLSVVFNVCRAVAFKSVNQSNL